jgi:hypothetical protein
MFNRINFLACKYIAFIQAKKELYVIFFKFLFFLQFLRCGSHTDDFFGFIKNNA